MKLFYEVKGVATIHTIDEKQIVILKWDKFNVQEEFKDVLNHIRECFGTTKFPRVLVDTSTTQGLISPENQKWMEEIHFPKLQEQGVCKFVATVVASSALAQMNTEKWQDNLVKIADMELINVPSREEGLEWLQSKNT